MTKKTETELSEPESAPEQEPAEKEISPHDVFGGPGEDGSDINLSDETKDLTESITGLWPGNPSQRQGSFFITLARLNLEEGQTGMIGYFPEGFVFESVDMHCISANDRDLNIAVLIGTDTPGTLLEVFDISAATGKISREIINSPESGSCVGNQNIYLKAMSDLPDEGRILITFIGYLIETWR